MTLDLSRFRIFIVSLLLAVFLVVPTQAFAQTATYEDTYRAVLIELIEVLQAQISALQAELDKRTNIEEEETEGLEVFKELGVLSERVQVTNIYQVPSTADVSDIKKCSSSGLFPTNVHHFPS